MTTHVSPQSYRADIDGLRAVAVLAVVAYHFFPARALSGFIGVDIFFVISGYLITGLIVEDLRAERFSLANFYARRVRRIVPALVAVLLATLVAGVLVLVPDELRSLGRSTLAGAGFAANLALLFEPPYFNTAAELNALLHLWSLGIEEQFYIAWPLSLPLLWRLASNGRWMLPSIILLLALSLLLCLMLVERQPQQAFYLPVTRAWELLAGAALVLLGIRPEARWAFVLSCVGAALLALGLLLIHPHRLYPSAWTLLPVAGCALLIAAGPQAPLNRLLGHRYLAAVGLISYPLYLWHWPMLAMLKQADLGLGVGALRLVKLGLLLLALLLSYATWRWIERPIRRSEGLRWVRPLLALLLVCALLGGALWASGGLPGRLNGQQNALLEHARQQRAALPEHYREGSCFLNPEQDGRHRAAYCSPDRGAAPMVLLWGDSHAAHLYAGLAALTKAQGLDLAQFTATDCPPIPGLRPRGRPGCAELNQQTLAWVGRSKPDLVVLAGDWLSLQQVDLLADTLNSLRQAGAGQVLVVGPVPAYNTRLPTQLLPRLARGQVVENIQLPELPALRDLEARLFKVAQSGGAKVVSALQHLCDQRQCVVMVDGRIEQLITWDSAHLTGFGSRWFADRALAQPLAQILVR